MICRRHIAVDQMLNEFYTPFHETVVKASTEKDRKRVGEEFLELTLRAENKYQ